MIVRKKYVHPLWAMRPRLPRGCHLSGPHRRPVRLYPLRPMRTVLPRLPCDGRDIDARPVRGEVPYDEKSLRSLSLT